jgi:hypothetical protein
MLKKQVSRRSNIIISFSNLRKRISIIGTIGEVRANKPLPIGKALVKTVVGWVTSENSVQNDREKSVLSSRRKISQQTTCRNILN